MTTDLCQGLALATALIGCVGMTAAAVVDVPVALYWCFIALVVVGNVAHVTITVRAGRKTR